MYTPSKFSEFSKIYQFLGKPLNSGHKCLKLFNTSADFHFEQNYNPSLFNQNAKIFFKWKFYNVIPNVLSIPKYLSFPKFITFLGNR